jgi:iron complex outermembrane receptor protein
LTNTMLHAIFPEIKQDFRGPRTKESGWKRMSARAVRSALASAIVSVWLLVPASAAASDSGSITDLKNLSIDELANMQISSVSKKAESLSDAAAAIYVITNEDIARAGATSIPEMLRLAPNLDVAQISASSYAISSRGFNNNIADKLLVLIDGRSVYTPIFAGVYWDMQYVPPQNIDRIEVISGPGGTLWGANAVNGVINIITRNSSDTQGGLIDLSAGNFNREASLQYGGRINADLTYGMYGNFSAILHNHKADGTTAGDSWHKGQGGFRADWTGESDLVTVQGALFSASEQRLAMNDATLSGGNVVSRWNHTFDNGSGLQVQAYYDGERRRSPGGASGDGQRLDTYDLDAQYNFALNSWNAVVVGGGYRINDYLLMGQPAFQFRPNSGSLRLGNVFIDDTISVSESVKLTVGVKVEDDAYVSLQPLPSIRASWKVTPTNMLWAGVSRVVRAPTPFDRDVLLGGPPALLIGGANFQSEKLTAYELGYRGQPNSSSTLSISTFYHRYTSLRSEGYTPTFFPIEFTNTAYGDTYGVEVWGSYKVADWWTLGAGLKVQHEKLSFPIPITATGPLGDFEIAVAPLLVNQAIGFTGNDAEHQFSIRSSMSLPGDINLTAELRKVGELPNPALPSYVELNANLSWRINKDLRLSLAGFNLLHSHHAEFIDNGTTITLKRSFILRAARSF